VLGGTAGKRREITKRAGKFVRVFGDPDLPPNTFSLRSQGAEAEVEEMEEPVQRGQELKVTIDAVDPVCDKDGLANYNGYIITVLGAGGEVGAEKAVRIVAAEGNRAFGLLVKPARRRRKRGGRRRSASVLAASTGVRQVPAGVISADEIEEELATVLEEAEGPQQADDSDGLTEIPERHILIDEDLVDDDVDDDDEDIDEDVDEDDEEDVQDSSSVVEDDDVSDEVDDDEDDEDDDDESLSVGSADSDADEDEAENEDTKSTEVKDNAASTSGASQRPPGAPRKRRRGSRGGRNRSRSGTGQGGQGGQNRGTGSTGANRGGSGGGNSGGSSTSGNDS
jgi:predicted RNA-binding protein with TRAM domain